MMSTDGKLYIYSVKDKKSLYSFPVNPGHSFQGDGKIYYYEYSRRDIQVYDFQKGIQVSNDRDIIAERFSLPTIKLKNWDEFGRIALVLPDMKYTSYQLKNGNRLYWKIQQFDAKTVESQLLLLNTEGEVLNENSVEWDRSYFDFMEDEKGSLNPLPRLIPQTESSFIIFNQHKVDRVKLTVNQLQIEHLLSLESSDTILGRVDEVLIISRGENFLAYDTQKEKYLDQLPSNFQEFNFKNLSSKGLNDYYKSSFFQQGNLFFEVVKEEQTCEVKSFKDNRKINLPRRPISSVTNSDNESYFLIKEDNQYMVYNWNGDVIWKPYRDSNDYRAISLNNVGDGFIAKCYNEFSGLNKYYFVDLRNGRANAISLQSNQERDGHCKDGKHVLILEDQHAFQINQIDILSTQSRQKNQSKRHIAQEFFIGDANRLILVDTLQNQILVESIFLDSEREIKISPEMARKIFSVHFSNGHVVALTEENIMVFSVENGMEVFNLNHLLGKAFTSNVKPLINQFTSYEITTSGIFCFTLGNRQFYAFDLKNRVWMTALSNYTNANYLEYFHRNWETYKLEPTEFYPYQPDGMPKNVYDFHIVNQENSVITNTTDSLLYQYSLRSGKLEGVYKDHHHWPKFLKTSQVGNYVAVGNEEEDLQVFEVGKFDRPLLEIKGKAQGFIHTNSNHDYVLFSRRDSLFSCHLKNKTIHLVDALFGSIEMITSDFLKNQYGREWGVVQKSEITMMIFDTQDPSRKYHFIHLDSLNWLAYDDDYHYDGTPGAREQLYFTCGLEIIELSQLKDALYVPGLVEKIMSGQPIQYPKLSELEICGTLPLIEKVKDSLYHYIIIPRKLGLKRVELYINGKRVMSKKPEELKKVEEYYEWNIEEKEIEKFFVPGEENEVKVIGIVQQGNNEMQSRGVVEEVDIPETKKEHPNFYGLMVGVSDYKDDRLDLKYPTKDSKDVGKVMEAAAKKLLNTSTENHVKMYYVNSEVKGENGFTTPERAGVKMALESIAKEAKAEDVVMIFFAGHGVMEGDKDKRFTFLTAESTKENLVGISTKDLEQWMSGENGYLPNKTILIFDACNSGQATEELMAMARDDDETQRIRQVEDLKDKSGMFIMSASAANQSAYELPRYGHGLLTYSLLKTLKTSSSTLDEEKFINVQKWFLETETTMDNMTRELGIEQEAQPFGRGNIRVGELDEEIRGDIEIQQEKPMVFCANALNLDTDDDDLLLKQLFNDYLKNYQTRGEAKVALATQEKGSIKVNFKYSLGSDGQLQGLASIFINGNKEQISWKGKPSDLELFFKQVLWVVE